MWIIGTRDTGSNVSVKMRRKDIKKELMRLDGYQDVENYFYDVEVRVPPSRILQIESGESLTIQLPRLRLRSHVTGTKCTRDTALDKYSVRTFVCSVRMITNRTRNSNYIHRARVRITTKETH